MDDETDLTKRLEQLELNVWWTRRLLVEGMRCLSIVKNVMYIVTTLVAAGCLIAVVVAIKNLQAVIQLLGAMIK